MPRRATKKNPLKVRMPHHNCLKKSTKILPFSPYYAGKCGYILFKNCLIKFASLLCRGYQTFIFCGVRMPPQHMPPKHLNSIQVFLTIFFLKAYIDQIPEKSGSRYQNLVLSQFLRKKQVLANKTRFLMKQLRHNPQKNRRKPVKIHQNQQKTVKYRSLKPTKSLVCRGHQTLFFVGLECLRSICPQNF